ncbi:TraB/GumN family protein [Psychrobium sp. nBUS_13]|uniref:TraB/GumN family protein n=1 Tax=Psychrobium sp. nBUS_13 TaxID=3395319 RepID=UPI003EBC58C2
MKTTKLLKSLSVSAILISSALSNFAAADAAVWKVSNGQNELFIAGTVHILPPSEFPLPTEFDKAYQQADSIVLEAKLPDPTDQEAQMAMIQKLAYPAGETLSQKISVSTYKELKQYLGGLGLNLDELNGFKPGFVLSMMTVMEAHKAGLAGEGVDAFYDKQAKKDNKEVNYLETAEFQLNMLANIGKDNEEKFILETLKEMSQFKPQLEQLIAAWRAGDINAIDSLILEQAKSKDPQGYQSMFTDRNRNWIPQISEMLNDKDKELVLVGAGHLAGDDSVLKMLKAKGYSVTKL